MFDKRNRWIISIVMGIAALAFLGLLIFPFVGAFQNQPRTAASPTASPQSSSQQAELEAQAKGYELVVQREPNNQTALRGLLETRIQLGDVAGAIQPLEKLAELNPEQTDYVVLLAQAKERMGDREGAAQSYRNVLSSRPGDIKALQGFVELQLRQDRPEAAIGLLQNTLRTATEANRVQPNSVDAAAVQLLLGRVYAEEQRYAEAIAIYDELIRTDQQDFRPVLAKAIVLRTQGRTSEAEPLFTSAASLAPAQYKDQINQLAASGESPLEANPTTPAPNAGAAPAPEAEPAEAPQ